MPLWRRISKLRLSTISARWHWLLLLGLPLLAFTSYFGQQLSIDGDNLLHLYRLVALHKNIAEGNFYPRWTAELFLGFGYPLLNFYASSTYYLAELYHLFGMGYENSLIYTMLILLIVAGLGTYYLAAEIFAELGVKNKGPALIATAAYVFAPYLLFNLYVRGAIAEVGAQALLPWILRAFRRLMCGDKPLQSVPAAIFCLAALAFTHTVSLILVPPALIAYACVLLWRYRTNRHELWRRIGWFAVATISAAAISAVFWLPALAERQFLTTQAAEAAARFLPDHVWNWTNFVEWRWLVAYQEPPGTNLRLVQLLLALMGAFLIRRWNAEWLFLIALALISCLLVAEAAIPIWKSVPLLLTVQFPWRMLGIATLPLSLLTGGIASRDWFVQGTGWHYKAIVPALIISAIIFANFPRMGWLIHLAVEPDQINLTSISQYEAITKRYGLSSPSFREFMPRWVKEFDLKSLPSLTAENPLTVTLEHAGVQTLEMDVAASRPSPMQFTTLYFPGWQVKLEDGHSLASYPSSDLGLLTVDLPMGEHHLSASMLAPPDRRWGQAITLLSLLLLGVICLSVSALRFWAILPFAPLLIAGALTAVAPWYAPTYYPSPKQPVQEGVQLLGYTSYQEDNEAIYIFPHWYVEKVPADLKMHWQLLDQAGHAVVTVEGFPYFNTLRAFQWSANMMVDDAYYLPLPPGLAAGSYTLALAVTPTAVDTAAAPQPVGMLKISHNVPPLPHFAHASDVTFQTPEKLQKTGDRNQIRLRGYIANDASDTDSTPSEQAKGADLTPAPGDEVTYEFSWQSDQAVADGTQIFCQLLDHNHQTLTQVNQPLQLSHGAPYYLWSPNWVRQNRCHFHIPQEAVGGLYQPYIGIYDLATGDRFATRGSDGTEIGSGLFLSPLKVVQRNAPPLANKAAVNFGNVIQLEGYELQLPSMGVEPQSVITLTLQYKSLAPTTVDYTQFVHLENAQSGMAAQFDAPPQGNGNPTSTWVPGEVIVDTIPLQISEKAKPGEYTLSLGLYDPAAGGARLAASNQNNLPLPDNQFVLGEIEIK